MPCDRRSSLTTLGRRPREAAARGERRIWARGCGGSPHRIGGAWWKLSSAYGRCEDVRVGRCVHSGFVLPHGRVYFGQGESPVKLFGKLFGKSARDEAARHRAPRHGQADEQGTDRPLFRDQVPGTGTDNSGASGASSVDPAGPGRIGFGESSTSGTGESSPPGRRVRPCRSVRGAGIATARPVVSAPTAAHR